MKKFVVLPVLIAATYSSYAVGQATFMIATYTMTCVPENPVKGPD
jgi:hypothetical protein